MKFLLAFATAALLSTPVWPAPPATLPIVEQSIYQPAPPFVDLKQAIYVRERERPLLRRITGASDAIVAFLIDLHDRKKTPADIRHVLPGSRSILRMPPQATSGQGRFVDVLLYCWTSDRDDQLTFLIEWADVTTNARYTDSYVFVRQGTSWYFEKHGSVQPWRWTKTERYFQRSCPASPLAAGA